MKRNNNYRNIKTAATHAPSWIHKLFLKELDQAKHSLTTSFQVVQKNLHQYFNLQVCPSFCRAAVAVASLWVLSNEKWLLPPKLSVLEILPLQRIGVTDVFAHLGIFVFDFVPFEPCSMPSDVF